MKLPLLISALILVALSLLCYAPDAVVSYKSPEPEPQWVPDPMEVIFWRLDRWGDCNLKSPWLDGYNRCPEFI